MKYLVLTLALVGCSTTPIGPANDSPPPEVQSIGSSSVYECVPKDVQTFGGFNTWADDKCEGDFASEKLNGHDYAFDVSANRLYRAGAPVDVVYVHDPSPNGPCLPLQQPGPFYLQVPVETETVDGVVWK